MYINKSKFKGNYSSNIEHNYHNIYKNKAIVPHDISNWNSTFNKDCYKDIKGFENSIQNVLHTYFTNRGIIVNRFMFNSSGNNIFLYCEIITISNNSLFNNCVFSNKNKSLKKVEKLGVSLFEIFQLEKLIRNVIFKNSGFNVSLSIGDLNNYYKPSKVHTYNSKNNKFQNIDSLVNLFFM